MRIPLAAIATLCVACAPAAPQDSKDDVAKLIEAGVKRLVEVQEQDGAWTYQGVVGKPVGYRIGGTALTVMALMTAPFADKGARKAIDRGVAFVEEALKDDGMTATFDGTYDTRGWGHITALELFARRGMKSQAASMVDALAKTEIEGGGWNYSRPQKACAPSSFMTASALVALRAARDAGVDVPQPLVDRSIGVLKKARLKETAYAYAVREKNAMDLAPGSIARGPLVELALSQWKQGDADALVRSIDAFFAHWDELEKRRKKTGTHAGKYAIAPYYFYYGHLYGALAIELTPAAKRDEYRRKMVELLIKTRDEDGTWNDRVFELSRGYGTAMAILALQAGRAR